MGMYTEIFINVDLIEGVSGDIVSTLQAICSHNYEYLSYMKLPEKWGSLFRDGSYYTPSTSCANLTYNNISKQWSLLGKGDIKNYNEEIQSFFDWIMPYIDANEGEFIGYSRYEEEDLPEIYVKE